MAQNFVACDREQELLLPPSLREWLPEGHLAWFVIDAVAAFDLSAFYAAYRAEGHGRPACDPAMMVARMLGDGLTVLVPPDATNRSGAPRLGRRPLRLHAQRPGHRRGRRALRQTPDDDRAALSRTRSSIVG